VSNHPVPLDTIGTHLRTLTPRKVRAMLEGIEQGVPLRTAARLAGIGLAQLYRWLQIAAGKEHTWHGGAPVSEGALREIKLLAELIADAQSRFEASMVGKIREAAMEPDKWGRRDWRAAAFLLTHSPATRQHWYEYRPVDVQVQGEVTHEHRLVRGMTLEQLDALEAKILEARQRDMGDEQQGGGG
jgi:hypothetical protein